jgi:hypothetical protein
METEPASASASAAGVSRALELLREVERVLDEMSSDLSLAEARLARAAEPAPRRPEPSASNA